MQAVVSVTLLSHHVPIRVEQLLVYGHTPFTPHAVAILLREAAVRRAGEDDDGGFGYPVATEGV